MHTSLTDIHSITEHYIHLHTDAHTTNSTGSRCTNCVRRLATGLKASDHEPVGLRDI
jgi:hypothetical protein